MDSPSDSLHSAGVNYQSWLMRKLNNVSVLFSSSQKSKLKRWAFQWMWPFCKCKHDFRSCRSPTVLRSECGEAGRDVLGKQNISEVFFCSSSSLEASRHSTKTWLVASRNKRSSSCLKGDWQEKRENDLWFDSRVGYFWVMLTKLNVWRDWVGLSVSVREITGVKMWP